MTERITRTSVPFSPQIVDAMSMRRQIVLPTDTHFIPETNEEIEKAARLSEKLIQLMRDRDLFSVIGWLTTIADSLVSEGEITEDQYLSIQNVYESVTLASE